MQVSVESGEGLERRMTVDLPAEQFEAEVANRLQQVARSARLPGFRPGKVPLKILRQRFGEQVNQEVFGDLMQSSFSEAVGQQQLRPAGPPRVVPSIDHAGRRYGYTATFEVLPSITLAAPEDRVIKRPVAEVGDADLDAMLDRLRQQRKTWTKVDRPAEHGDRVIASFTGIVDGEPVQGGSAQDRPIEIGAEHLIPGFEDGLVGISAGETRTLNLAFPDGYHAKHLAGKPVVFEVSVSAVESPVVPELDAGLARSYGVEDGDVERFRQDVRANMERELRQRIQARVKNQVMDALIAVNPVEVPGVLVREEIAVLKDRTNRNAGPSTMQLPDALFEESATSARGPGAHHRRGGAAKRDRGGPAAGACRRRGHGVHLRDPEGGRGPLLLQQGEPGQRRDHGPRGSGRGLGDGPCPGRGRAHVVSAVDGDRRRPLRPRCSRAPLRPGRTSSASTR